MRKPIVRRVQVAAFVMCIALLGPARLASAGLFSATGPVIAILGGELYTGEAEGHLNGAGTLAIHSQKDPTLTCVGQFTSSAALGGSGQLQCSDGGTATFSFQRLNAFRGYGTGNTSRGSMSFAYGLSVENARPYLHLPHGKQLSQTGTQLALIDH